MPKKGIREGYVPEKPPEQLPKKGFVPETPPPPPPKKPAGGDKEGE